ncbi:Por secretion system C-terminal sorting domain-containing protein [Halpernia humi]|uniref:Por secretion system C-terminal sorting domain-containing protein n=1 Tax=Halpernia humi TaxID=493375 RepID=A0A1H5Y727_9FLAO|nr:T9SS type A sorting domain-containing protein [Halpernia humi]SEG19410.1 Por secretion system C-terminal sorting domain-containing protein [Halpernia humi]
MKKAFIFSAICIGTLIFSQTINFKGCIPLFDDQMFTLNQTSTDSFGKKIYVTTPVNGDQPCGGIGTCEFKLQWNDTAGRWEFLADKGNGDFVDPFLIYYSTTQNTSADNPPNASIGTWVENTAVTTGACGGDLTDTNSTFTGDVRTTTLAVNEFDSTKITVYPNPATEYVNISGLSNIKTIKIISIDGKLISILKNSNKINVGKLARGVYFLEIQTDNAVIKRVKFIKK